MWSENQFWILFFGFGFGWITGVVKLRRLCRSLCVWFFDLGRAFLRKYHLDSMRCSLLVGLCLLYFGSGNLSFPHLKCTLLTRFPALFRILSMLKNRFVVILYQSELKLQGKLRSLLGNWEGMRILKSHKLLWGRNSNVFHTH